MDFDHLLDQAIEMLQRRGRLTYRTLRRQFQLDDAALEDLKVELLFSQPVADEAGQGLVWVEPERPRGPTQELLSYTPKYLTEKILTSRSALEGERKQVTVLFADIKDSTEFIRDLDPEEAQQLLDPAIHIMMDAVHRFEGTVNQVLGDGIMSIFGAPIAHEDHAARACYAALAMQTSMRPYAESVRRSQGIPLQIRVGLNAGEVVVRTIGNDLHMDYSAVGPTTHLAARMEQLATPGSIVLSGATLKLVEGLVRVNDLGLIPVKGMSEPVEVFELTGASAIKRRLQAAVARGLTKFVGREAEIGALHQALAQAGSGHGQVVAAVGEAGVGKSRLLYEFIQSHRTQGWRVLESASLSYGKATPYFPIVDMLKRYAHVEDGDEARTVRAKLTGQVLTLDEALHPITPALLALCDVLPDDHPFHQLDPPQRRQQTLNGLQRLLLRESQEQPLVLVFEDLHWIDSETQTLLDNLVESLPTARILLLINYRPEYQHSWDSKTYYTQCRLDPLPPERADEFLDALLGDDDSLEYLKKQLIERTAGNPFFLEESVRTLVETQVLGGASGAYRLLQNIPTILLPATVQAILAARMDRLPEDEKRLLQMAAVIGADVPFSLLQTISEMPEAALHPGITHLQSAEFLYETSLFPERVLTFKHALTHEVAYNSLLQEQRRALHGRILEALERLSNDGRTEEVERLAQHAWRGEVWEQALSYLTQAGTKATARSASREAIGYYEQALAACDHLPPQRALHVQAIDLRLELHHARFVLDDHEGSFNDLREAERLSQALDDAPRLARVRLHMALSFYVTGAYAQADALAHRACDLAMTGQDTAIQALAHSYLGVIAYAQGAYLQCRDYGRRARGILQDHLLYDRSQQVIPVHVRYRLALCLAELGAFAEGASMGREGLHIAEEMNQPASLTLAFYSIGAVYLRQGDLRQALSFLERGIYICREANLRRYFSHIAPALGAAYILDGRAAEALTLLEEAVTLAASIGRIDLQASRVRTLGEAHLHAGHVETASDLAAQALDLARAYHERGNEAYVLRLLGEIAAQRGPSASDQAATFYQQALALADELGMRPLQAHCHRDLGALYRQTGQAAQACGELSTAMEMYRDMEMAFWLPETEAALADVEQQ